MEKKSHTENKQKEIKRLLQAIIFLILVIAVFATYMSWPLLTGKTVVLATRPVDPFDVFRGQYLSIAYEIGTIPAIPGAKQGNTVYVTIRPDKENIWHYQDASLQKPKNGIFLKGTITSANEEQMTLEYGIEQFFFERNAEFPARNFTVEAKVSSSGDSRISNILWKGEPVVIDYKQPSITS